MEMSKGVRIAGEHRAQLASDFKSRYEEGASIRTIAASSGRSYGFVHQVLSEADVALRGRGRAARHVSS